MATINNIQTTNYGLYVSTYLGVGSLPEGKEQFYTIFGKAGYQITKRRANTLEMRGFIIADDLADFKTKTGDLYTLFSSVGTKIINLGNGDLECFAKEGFKITNVIVQGKVFAKFYIKLAIL